MTFMHSIPNFIPLSPIDVHRIFSIVRDLEFDDVHSFTWGFNIISDGRRLVVASVNHYLVVARAKPISRIQFPSWDRPGNAFQSALA